MKPIKTILWIQLAFGLVGGYVAFADIHWGAMSAAWAYNLRAEYDKMKQSPDFHEPPAINGQSIAKILDDMAVYGRARADVAGCWLLACGALVVFATVMLWFLRRAAPSNKSRGCVKTPARRE